MGTSTPVSPGVYVPATPGVPGAIRRYANAGIEADMGAVLAGLAPGKSGAVVAHIDPETWTVRGAIYCRKPGRFFGILPPGEWSYVGTLGYTLKGKLDAGAAVAYSW